MSRFRSIPTEAEFEAAKALLESAGFVVLREKSYRQAQERQRIAKCMEDMERDRREGVERWARDCCAEERRIRDRLTFVYGVARAHGATLEDLRQPELEPVDV